VLELVAQDDAADVVDLLLVVELRGVDACNDVFLRVLLFEPLEVGDDVDAVDAAVSSEVEQHDFAAQLRERERPVGVEPPARRRTRALATLAVSSRPPPPLRRALPALIPRPGRARRRRRTQPTRSDS
jgi:hypothetical protein